MLAASKVKMSGSEKKKKGAGTCDEEDSRCNNNGKEISKKRVLHLQSCWFVFAN